MINVLVVVQQLQRMTSARMSNLSIESPSEFYDAAEQLESSCSDYSEVIFYFTIILTNIVFMVLKYCNLFFVDCFGVVVFLLIAGASGTVLCRRRSLSLLAVLFLY